MHHRSVSSNVYSVLVPQVGPSQPGVHAQLVVPEPGAPSEQLPPFKQVPAAQSTTSWSQPVPSQPELHWKAQPDVHAEFVGLVLGHVEHVAVCSSVEQMPAVNCWPGLQSLLVVHW